MENCFHHNFQCCWLTTHSPQLLLLLLSRWLLRLLCWDVGHLDRVGRIEVDGDDSVTLDNFLNTGHPLFHTLLIHPKFKVTNKQTSNILGFYAKRRKLGLGWSLTILASSAPHYIPWPTFPLLSQLPNISVPSPGRVRVPSQLFRRADVTSSFTSYLGKSARKKSHLWRTSLLSSFIPPCHWLWRAHPSEYRSSAA